MSDVTEHTGEELEEALREELEKEVLSKIGLVPTGSPKFPPGINLSGSSTSGGTYPHASRAGCGHERWGGVW